MRALGTVGDGRSNRDAPGECFQDVARMSSSDNERLQDRRAIENNDDINPNTPWTNLLSNDFWGTPLTHSGSHKSYRPLCVATFRLNFFLHGLNPVGYHLVNVALHGLATALFASTCRSLLFRDSVAVWTAALTFAAHPVHVEAVAGLVGRADVLACITFLLSFSAYRRHVTARTKAAFESGASNHSSSRHAAAATRQLAACVALAGVSMLCKEHGITVLAVCAGYDVFVVARMTWKDIWSLGDTKGKFKRRANDRWPRRRGLNASADNPAAQSEALLTRTSTFAFLPVLNFLLLLWPRWLSFDWSMDTVPLVESLTDSRVAATACFYGLLVALVHKAYSSKDRGLTTALLLLIVPFIPASNLLFHVGFVVAERVLYLPSTGFCLLVGLGAGLVARRRRHLARVLVAVVLCAFAARTLVRNRDWVDEHALYTSGIPVNPAKSYGNLGRVLSAEGREKEAEAAYMSAIRLRPNMADAHYNL
ncbi:unnamed protein product [Notodromas monacha]|uniref:dolichyl-phosphate-mannose--protein mannosyltransferase n=1 Tax=Notodromas monacha TaxID=399045 RepID=A0A7R9GD95_9CRUS|nr:unnamed protein product [Notodromas monacha]CAG0918309.1 unnamed protein product [Notodromas monacha]